MKRDVIGCSFSIVGVKGLRDVSGGVDRLIAAHWTITTQESIVLNISDAIKIPYKRRADTHFFMRI